MSMRVRWTAKPSAVTKPNLTLNAYTGLISFKLRELKCTREAQQNPGTHSISPRLLV